MKEWRVKIQLGAWTGYVYVEAATAKEAHQCVLEAALKCGHA